MADTFFYESYEYDVQSDGLHISFCFRKDEHLFKPTALIEARPFLHPENIAKPLLDALVFNIGMIELISYWKAFCTPEVVVKPHRIDDKQMTFWKKLYYNGLGEFFYTNGIKADPEEFMSIESFGEEFSLSAGGKEEPIGSSKDYFTIVPIGGGKDSVVTLELMKNGDGQRPIPLIMNPRGATVQCVERAGYTMDDVIVIKRIIHPHLLELNKQGALNGHTPFSAMLAFYTVLAATLTGNACRIALSNESSANESTVPGTNVNHQYSKSLEFEDDFRRYTVGSLSPLYASADLPMPDYYSFLRPLSELQIAMLFSRYPHYFDVFKSCNVGSKEDIWCGHCAKCLFAYIILSPFIEPDRLNAIFGKNMLDDLSLKKEFDELTGVAPVKPFECVGTVSEVNAALSMSIGRWYKDKRPALIADYSVSTDLNVRKLLQGQMFPNNMPADNLLLLYFNLFAEEEILIAGYGREGQSTHAVLKRVFPNREFDITHDNDELVEALRKKSYGLIIKSPGIPSMLLEGLCDMDAVTSQTDIFLQLFGDRTIGITGTKGKSTTASLIASVLSQNTDRDVVLAGNIGIPLFDVAPRLTRQSLVVAELSCHQLENIHRGPHVAVILNLFQEHLDHYKDYHGYKMAKMQIALQQQKGDHFFYCPNGGDLDEMVQSLRGQIVSEIHPYTLDSSGFECQSLLQGPHNRSNIAVAWLVARLYGVGEEQFKAAVASFHPLEHRLEPVATISGVDYYNDSISTIPQAAIAAIEALGKVQTLILGGFDRGIDYMPLIDFLCESEKGKTIDNLVFFGSAGKRMHDAFAEKNSIARRELCHFEADYSMSEAVAFAAANTAKGRICLLSPAASSYDHYKNFEFRGRHFKECVMNLIKL